MDSSFTIKPRDSLSRVVHDRASTVRTDLAPSQSVTTAKPVPAVHAAPNAGDTMAPNVSIHPDSQDVIYRVREEREKRKRAADEALSRMRAYRGHDAPSAERPDDASDEHADIQV